MPGWEYAFLADSCKDGEILYVRVISNGINLCRYVVYPIYSMMRCLHHSTTTTFIQQCQHWGLQKHRRVIVFFRSDKPLLLSDKAAEFPVARWKKLSRFQPYVRHAPYSWRPSEISKVIIAATIVEYAWESLMVRVNLKFVNFETSDRF